MGMLVFYAGNFLVWCFGVFAGGFGEIGVSTWCFCGVDVVDWVGKVVCGKTVFEEGNFAGFWNLFLGERKAVRA
jgi:hypothetical protein